MFLTCFCYDSQSDNLYNEAIAIDVRTNLSEEELRNRDILSEVAKTYYAKRDYPDF